MRAQGSTIHKTHRSGGDKHALWMVEEVNPQGGHACFVVGNSSTRGQTTGHTEWLAVQAGNAGFSEAARHVPPTKPRAAKAMNRVR